MGEERIEINIPDYSLKLMDGDDLVHRARVIVGKPDTPTPIFSNEMRYILVNPIWRVPDSIVKQELAPGARAGPGLSRAARLPGDAGRRSAGRRASRPARATRSGASLFMFPNEHARLSARHAGARAVRGASARLQPRLRARRAADAAGRTGDGRRERGVVAARACNRCSAANERTVFAAPHDPDPPRIFHRIRRRIRRLAGSRRHLRDRPTRRRHICPHESRLKRQRLSDYRGRGRLFSRSVLFVTHRRRHGARGPAARAPCGRALGGGAERDRKRDNSFGV